MLLYRAEAADNFNFLSTTERQNIVFILSIPPNNLNWKQQATAYFDAFPKKVNKMSVPTRKFPLWAANKNNEN